MAPAMHKKNTGPKNFEVWIGIYYTITQFVRHTPCLELFVCVCEINRHTPKYYYKTVHLH